MSGTGFLAGDETRGIQEAYFTGSYQALEVWTNSCIELRIQSLVLSLDGGTH